MRVLIIEDEAPIAESVTRALSAEGIESAVANNGEDGLAMARRGNYDVIVLDLLLPRKNGYVVCRELREEGNSTPILVTSAKSGEWDQADMLELGADDYLVKPYSLVVLVAHLRALGRRAGGAGELAVGALKLDRERRQVERNGTLIDLSPREFALLEALMAAEGATVSKEDLLVDVWANSVSDPNIVEVYIGYLRKKIDVPFGTKSLQTVRGAGYRLVE